MASISFDPANLRVLLVCGAAEDDVVFTAPDIYAAWKDWFLDSDNSKYLPAFDSAGGDPVGASNLDNVYFLLTNNGWSIAPDTTEDPTRIVIEGNLFPDVVGAPLYDYALSAGNTHMEMLVSTSARQIETGTSGLTSGESAQLDAMAAKLAQVVIEAGRVLSDIRAVRGQPVNGAGSEADPWGP